MPENVLRDTERTLTFLRRMDAGSTRLERIKLMFVGLGGAGKTSLVRALRASDLNAATNAAAANETSVTDGIDIALWRTKHTDGEDDYEFTFALWDFAGQSVYYNTHQFFMSNRAIYLLLWNARLGYEHSGLEFWLSSIACLAPEATVMVVSTHADMVELID